VAANKKMSAQKLADEAMVVIMMVIMMVLICNDLNGIS